MPKDLQIVSKQLHEFFTTGATSAKYYVAFSRYCATYRTNPPSRSSRGRSWAPRWPGTTSHHPPVVSCLLGSRVVSLLPLLWVWWGQKLRIRTVPSLAVFITFVVSIHSLSSHPKRATDTYNCTLTFPLPSFHMRVSFFALMPSY